MKTKIIKYVTATVVCGIFVSCSDFLDQRPQSSIVPGDFYQTEDQVQAAVNAFYENILPSHSGAGYGTFAYDNGTDNQTGTDGDAKYVKDNWKVGQDNSSWSWSNIHQVNYQLDTIMSNYRAKKISGEDYKIRQYIGELYFFRAYSYFSLLRNFGDLPIITTALKDDQNILVNASKRSPCNEVARFILNDCDSAINYLEPDGGEATTRISPAATHLFASRVALFEGSWLTNFAGTPFVPNGPDWPGAKKDYNKNYGFPSGSLESEAKFFFKKATEEAEKVGDVYINQLSINNGIVPQSVSDNNPYFYMFGNTDMTPYKDVLLWRKYSKSLGVTDNIEAAIQHGDIYTGFSRSLIESFLMKDGKPIYASHTDEMGKAYFYEDSTTNVVVKNRDPRLYIFLKRPGQINVFKNLDYSAGADQVVNPEPVPKIYTRDFSTCYTTGYAIRKGGTFDQALCQNQYGYTASITFRATEALLNYIEAQYMLDNQLNSKSLSYWKAIRIAAGFKGAAIDPMITINATDMGQEVKGYSNGSGTEYDWGAFTAGKALTDKVLYSIRRERRCELMAEGLRWMDLVRWRSLDQLKKQPYHFEGFHLWNTPMEKNWYTANQLISDGSVNATVSPESSSEYFRPYEILKTNLLYKGMTWQMAQYLQPLPIHQFLLTSSDHTSIDKSPLYQNPYWPAESDMPAEQ
jgi:phage tail protein X